MVALINFSITIRGFLEIYHIEYLWNALTFFDNYSFVCSFGYTFLLVVRARANPSVAPKWGLKLEIAQV